MKRVIKYEYRYWDIGCGCCHDSSSTYDMWEDGVLVSEQVGCRCVSNEEALREVLAYLKPFDVHPDSQWF